MKSNSSDTSGSLKLGRMPPGNFGSDMIDNPSCLFGPVLLTELYCVVGHPTWLKSRVAPNQQYDPASGPPPQTQLRRAPFVLQMYGCPRLC